MVHKLLKLALPEGGESEVATMVIECCSQERSYLRFYGLIGQRFCLVRREYQEVPFANCRGVPPARILAVAARMFRSSKRRSSSSTTSSIG